MAPRSTIKKLSLVCLASTIVPSASALSVAITAAQALGILEQRDSSTCVNSTFNECSDPRLPSFFCCSPQTTCVSLASSTGALCCPNGQDCTFIKPIVCDIHQLNATAHPDNPVKTTNLDGTLPACGTNTCCPFGYTCQNNMCQIDKDTSATSGSPPSASSTASSSATTSSTATTTPSTSSTPTPIPAGSGINSTVAQTTKCPSFPGCAVAAGFFPGLIAGALLALLFVICLGKRHRDRPNSSSSSKKFGHYRNRSADGAIIGVSEPMPSHAQSSVRTDFLRRDQQDLGPKGRLQRTGSRVKSWFSTHSGHNNPYNRNNYEMPAQPPLPVQVPVTPPNQTHQPPRPGMVQREPSTESIRVYSPAGVFGKPIQGQEPAVQQSPSATGGLPTTRPQTTFTELMAKVGFQNERGSPHFVVGGPGTPGSGASPARRREV